MKSLLTLILSVFLSFAGFCQINGKVDPNLRIYILLGQSNMAGRGEITPVFANEGNAKVLMFNKDKQWVLAKHPLHFDKPKSAGVGPGLAFGIKMAEANPKQTIGLVPCAVGGTSITKWKPGAYDKDTDTHPYDDAVARIEEAMKTGIVAGVLWHQGESDTSPDKAANYLEKLEILIEKIRKVCKNQNLPFVVGELGVFKENRKIINEMIAPLATKVAHTAIAKANGLDHKGDDAHFNSASAQLLGYRFAEQMLLLQNKK